MDPAMVIEVSDRFRTEYAQPRLRNPLLSSGLLLDAVPAVPYANGALVHTEICDAKRDDREHEKLRKKKTCGCPPKMKSPAAEKNPTRPLFQYIWNLAASNPNIEAWPADACVSNLKKADVYSTVIKDKAFKKESILSTDINITIADLQKCVEAEQETNNNNKAEVKKLQVRLAFAKKCKTAGDIVLLSDDITLKTNEEWASTFAALDPLLSIWAERKALRKIITDYLPKMYHKDKNGVEYPAEIIRGSFYPLCLTGRSSSSASKLYPSRNEQNVDPRVRPCTIPRDGNVLVSTDYNGMELATLAQKCFNLFGHSVLADKIMRGVMNETEALEIARKLFHQNPKGLFNLSL